MPVPRRTNVPIFKKIRSFFILRARVRVFFDFFSSGPRKPKFLHINGTNSLRPHAKFCQNLNFGSRDNCAQTLSLYKPTSAGTYVRTFVRTYVPIIKSEPAGELMDIPSHKNMI